MMSVDLSNITILNIHGVDYRFIITGISKGEAVNLPQKADLNKSSVTLKNIKNLFSNIKKGQMNFNLWSY